ncbi:MAG: hypothetical protein U1F34_01780 [Gammaproteobacteria bacterium]
MHARACVLFRLPSGVATAVSIRFYDTGSIHRVAVDAPENGFSIVLIPATSQIHLDYASNAPGYEEMFLKPIAGWVTGVHLDDLGVVHPIVYNGVTGEMARDKALVMHVTLRPEKVATIGIVNTAKQAAATRWCSPKPDSKQCAAKSMAWNVTSPNTCAKKISISGCRWSPTTRDRMINVGLQKIDEQSGEVSFYGPVFKNVRYRFAAPVQDYVEAFQHAIPRLDKPVVFSCNCVLNYLYSELAGKQTAHITGQ